MVPNFSVKTPCDVGIDGWEDMGSCFDDRYVKPEAVDVFDE